MSAEKDRFDALMEQAKYWRDIRHERMQREWKVSVGVWALLAAGILVAKDLNVPACTLGIALGFLVFVHIVFWIKHNYDRGIVEMHRALHCINTARTIFPPNGGDQVTIENKPFICHFPNIFQSIATIALAILVLLAKVAYVPTPD